MREQNDIEYTNHGSIITMMPLTPAAADWVLENIPGDAQMFGGQICIEPRYFGEIAYGAQCDGLTSNVRVVPN
jgi:hypothetical protein